MSTAMLVAMHLAIVVAVPADVMTPAMATATAVEADAVWRAAGVTIEWSVGDRPGWRPDAPLLWVLFTDRCDGGRAGEMPIASMTFVDGKPTRRIVVCRSQALAVVDRAAPENHALPRRLHDELTARVMGRAVAHEIGHYLLGPAHAPSGLMRAQHSTADFCGADAAPFAVAPPVHVARALPAR